MSEKGLQLAFFDKSLYSTALNLNYETDFFGE